MTDETGGPGIRQHLREIRKALGGLGSDVKIEVADAPHLAKEGTKNAFARAAGVRRSSMREWSEPTGEDPK
ncbi:MAG: hypothetical protein WAK40_08690 [Thermoplasmata archaeon]